MPFDRPQGRTRRCGATQGPCTLGTGELHLYMINFGRTFYHPEIILAIPTSSLPNSKYLCEVGADRLQHLLSYRGLSIPHPVKHRVAVVQKWACARNTGRRRRPPTIRGLLGSERHVRSTPPLK